MHIPNGTTLDLDLLTFEDALRSAQTPSDHYDIEKWLYAPNFYSEYRYILGTKGKNPLICIGINPSTAEPDNLDNTLKSVERIAHGNGFDSFIMFNVYARRHGAAVQSNPPPGKLKSLPLCAVNFQNTHRLGRLGCHHRKAGLPC